MFDGHTPKYQNKLIINSHQNSICIRIDCAIKCVCVNNWNEFDLQVQKFESMASNLFKGKYPVRIHGVIIE